MTKVGARPRSVFPAILVSLGLAGPLVACAQEPRAGSPATNARVAWLMGDYDRSIELAEAALRANPGDASAAEALIRSLIDVGKPREAVARAATLGTNPGTSLALGDALRALGRRDEAREAWTRALASPDSLLARHHLAQLRFETGDHEGALSEFDRFIDIYNERRGSLGARDLRAVALSVWRLGRRDPQLFKDAMRAFDEALARDSTEIEAGVELGILFLEKFNSPEARKALTEVLAMNPRHARALVALAEVITFDGGRGAGDSVSRALSVNPVSPEGRTFAAMRLLDVERYVDAIAEAKLGLANDSLSAEPLAVIAAAQFITGDSSAFARTLSTLRTRYPRSAAAEVTIADVAARNRLYAEATRLAEAGVSRDSLSARALAVAGINAMRIGRIDDGRRSLERAFAIDPYDIWVKNTLDLLDTFADYTQIPTARFLIAAETKDAGILGQVVGPLAEEAWDSLSARYAFQPQRPVRIELFRSHADFSVRTVGLGGLGALGVSFGNVVAMDSPAARRVGEFNWGSTLWHELAHTFTLGASANRVPRWLSEGLSVHEERRARASWGSDASPTLIAAWEAGRLQPVSRLNDGFMRPRFPEEVTLSYALASYVCEMIESEKGIAAIRSLLDAYRRGRTTEEAFREVLGADITEFDKRFEGWFRRRFTNELQAVDAKKAEGPGGGIEWEGPLADAIAAATAAGAARQWDVATRELEKVKSLFPSFAGEGSSYQLLAQIALERGDTARAIAELRAMTTRNELAFSENLLLARLLGGRGDQRGSLEALERAVYITPFDASLHGLIAVAAAGVGAHRSNIRARQAIVALNPTDRVEALFELATAHAAAGELAAARREVLRALDLAPNYEKAQQLLLSLRQPEQRQ
ncbi:MAG: tetratricopeptide repeat protein [Gemmatimonadota bacterium]